MEGYTLHPRIDARGVHRFDVAEVEAVAQRIAETGKALDLCFPQTLASRSSARPLSNKATRFRHAGTQQKIEAPDVTNQDFLAVLADILEL